MVIVANENNLIYGDKLKPELAREYGRWGGIASGIARRKKARYLKDVRMLFQIMREQTAKAEQERAARAYKARRELARKRLMRSGTK